MSNIKLSKSRKGEEKYVYHMRLGERPKLQFRIPGVIIRYAILRMSVSLFAECVRGNVVALLNHDCDILFIRA